MGNFKVFIIEKKKLSDEVARNIYTIVVIGDLFEFEEKIIHKLFIVKKASNIPSDNISLINEPRQKPLFLYLNKYPKYNSGEPSKWMGKRSFAYIEFGAKLWKSLFSTSLITLPVSKEWIIKSGTPFQGHTEYLASLYNKNVIMCMYHQELSVIPLTNHIPISQVSNEVQKLKSKPITEAVNFFYKLFNPTKKIGFTGLNPHAGESGKIGSEEKKLKALFKKLENLYKIEGPLPADGIFSPVNRLKYSLIIACYHDQALIPFKTLYGPAGVNFTLNLPKLRVSPDHGPAYEIAGKNIASIESVKKCLELTMIKGKQWIRLYSSR